MIGKSEKIGNRKNVLHTLRSNIDPHHQFCKLHSFYTIRLGSKGRNIIVK